MNNTYQDQGYCVVKKLFNEAELEDLREVVLDFHQCWMQANKEFYAEKAVNSAYLTHVESLTQSQRIKLFQFIGSSKLMAAVDSVLPQPMFMNTQLFFNPKNKHQKNYWHRDPQYHLSLDQQKAALAGPEVIHFRIPLYDEPGIELIPGSHKNWDSKEELKVRLEQEGKRSSDDLSRGVCIELEAGDLLVFSANMIHRGLYGRERLALDILFCDPDPSLASFINSDCLPDNDVISRLEDGTAFMQTHRIKSIE
jgi:ectoine hydroxylase-related dioxygenase (phytanoyl-CoA dioxygenase family)